MQLLRNNRFKWDSVSTIPKRKDNSMNITKEITKITDSIIFCGLKEKEGCD